MAKIQVQGIGVYDDKTLKKKIIQLQVTYRRTLRRRSSTIGIGVYDDKILKTE